MKKKLQLLLTILTICAIALCVGCAKKQSSSTYDKPIEVNGEYNVGKFTVAVPSGWIVYPQSDRAQEPDENGVFPTAKDTILLAKCDIKTDELSAVTSKPNVRIYYYENKDAITPVDELYETTERISNVSIGGKACDSAMFYTDGLQIQEIIYETEGGTYLIEVLCAINEDPSGIAWNDKEVLPMIQSIKTN